MLINGKRKLEVCSNRSRKPIQKFISQKRVVVVNITNLKRERFVGFHRSAEEERERRLPIHRQFTTEEKEGQSRAGNTKNLWNANGK